jgi:hypothetical protein
MLGNPIPEHTLVPLLKDLDRVPGFGDAVPACGHAMPEDHDGVPAERHAVPERVDPVPGGADGLPQHDDEMPGRDDPLPDHLDQVPTHGRRPFAVSEVRRWARARISDKPLFSGATQQSRGPF